MDAQELSDLPGSRTVNAILAVAPGIQVAGFDVRREHGGSRAARIQRLRLPRIQPADAGRHRHQSAPAICVSARLWIFGPGMGRARRLRIAAAFAGRASTRCSRSREAIATAAASTPAIRVETGGRGTSIRTGRARRGRRGALSARDVNRQHGYQDEGTDSGGFFVRSSWWCAASVRDQRVSARVVSFPVSPIDTSAAMGSVKTTIRTGSTGSLVLYASGDNAAARPPGRILRSEAVNLSTDSISNREAKGLVWKAKGGRTAQRASLLASARVGQFVVRREDLPRGSSPRFEGLAAPAVDGGNRTWREGLRRTHVSGSLGYLHEDSAEGTQLTAGGESLHAVAARDVVPQSYAGDVLHVLRAGAPAEVYLFQTPSVAERAVVVLGISQRRVVRARPPDD